MEKAPLPREIKKGEWMYQPVTDRTAMEKKISQCEIRTGSSQTYTRSTGWMGGLPERAGN
jgi:hypothetical protein